MLKYNDFTLYNTYTRREKKDIYAALQREQTEREAELANKYRDRAAERRAGKTEDDASDLPGGFFGDSFKAAGDRKQQLIEQSKYLGGDLKHTHLVKGLDYALLQKIRAEQARKEEEEMAMQEEILDTQVQCHIKSLETYHFMSTSFKTPFLG